MKYGGDREGWNMGRETFEGTSGNRESHLGSSRTLNVSTGEALTISSGNLFLYGIVSVCTRLFES